MIGADSGVGSSSLIRALFDRGEWRKKRRGGREGRCGPVPASDANLEQDAGVRRPCFSTCLLGVGRRPDLPDTCQARLVTKTKKNNNQESSSWSVARIRRVAYAEKLLVECVERDRIEDRNLKVDTWVQRIRESVSTKFRRFDCAAWKKNESRKSAGTA